MILQSSRKSVLNKLHVYTNEDLPFALLKAMIRVTEEHLKIIDGVLRIGIMGIARDVAEGQGYKHSDMMDDRKCIEVGVKHFSDVLRRVRLDYSSLPYRDWYLLALACYREGYERVVRSLGNRSNKWMEIKIATKLGVAWAEDVWKLHLTLEGKKVL